MKKTILLSMMTVLLLSMSYPAMPSYAQDMPQEGQKKEERQRPPRRPQLTMEEMQTILSQK